jgi:hypothetical protein
MWTGNLRMHKPQIMGIVGVLGLGRAWVKRNKNGKINRNLSKIAKINKYFQ